MIGRFRRANASPEAAPPPEPAVPAADFTVDGLDRGDNALAETLLADIEAIAETLDAGNAEMTRNHARRLAFSYARLPRGQGGRLLDVGSDENLVRVLRERLDYDVTVCAYAPNAAPKVTTTKAGGEPTPTLRFDLEAHALPGEPESFDAVLMLEVIEHMAVDPIFAMANVNLALKPGGTLVISTVNCASLRSVRKALNGSNPWLYPPYVPGRSTNRHNHEYSAVELTMLAKASGFEVLERRCEHLLNPPDTELHDALTRAGLRVKDPGDVTVLTCRKISDTLERYPAFLYRPAGDGVRMSARDVVRHA